MGSVTMAKIQLTAKELGHGINVERYSTSTGKRMVILVAVSSNNPELECHYTVLDMEGDRSGIIYDRETAMRIAESKVQ